LLDLIVFVKYEVIALLNYQI